MSKTLLNQSLLRQWRQYFQRTNSAIFVVESSLQLVTRENRNMASNKKINIPICDLSSEEIYTLLDSTESDHEEDIDNLMNDSNKELVDYSLLEGGMGHKDIEHTTQDNILKLNFIPINLPIEAVAMQLQPDDDSEDDEPLCKTAKTK